MSRVSPSSGVVPILALRKEVAGITLPAAVVAAIGVVHDSLSKGTDCQGWRHVDWRGHGGGGGKKWAGHGHNHAYGRGGDGGGGGYGRRGGASSGSSGAAGAGGDEFRSFRAGGGRGTGAGAGAGAVSAPAAAPAPTPAPVPAAAPAPAPVATRPVRYVSRFKATTTLDDAILGTIRGKLNRFAPTNYADIFEFLCQILDSGQTDFLKDFMKLVFEKATSQEALCGDYVRLLSELSSKYDVLRSELIERYKAYCSIFTEIGDTGAADYDEYLEANAEKTYRLGYSQFLAEMLKYTVIDSDLFVCTLQSIIENIPKLLELEGKRRFVEEYTDCLMRILQAVERERTPVAIQLRAILKERFLETLRTLSKPSDAFKCQSQRGRFTMERIVAMIEAF